MTCIVVLCPDLDKNCRVLSGTVAQILKIPPKNQKTGKRKRIRKHAPLKIPWGRVPFESGSSQTAVFFYKKVPFAKLIRSKLSFNRKPTLKKQFYDIFRKGPVFAWSVWLWITFFSNIFIFIPLAFFKEKQNSIFDWHSGTMHWSWHQLKGSGSANY